MEPISKRGNLLSLTMADTLWLASSIRPCKHWSIPAHDNSQENESGRHRFGGHTPVTFQKKTAKHCPDFDIPRLVGQNQVNRFDAKLFRLTAITRLFLQQGPVPGTIRHAWETTGHSPPAAVAYTATNLWKAGGRAGATTALVPTQLMRAVGLFNNL